MVFFVAYSITRENPVGNSLQDQLLKAGLANKKQAVKARKAQHNKQKMKSAGHTVKDEATILAEQAQQEQVARDKELNRLKQEAAEAKAVKAQIKQLITLNQISERGDVEFRFTHGSSIKTLMLETAHRDAVVKGSLCVVALENSYTLVPTPVADKIAQRDADVIILRNTSEEESTDVDDDYAEYEIPDDLMW